MEALLQLEFLRTLILCVGIRPAMGLRQVLHAAGVEKPRALVVVYTARGKAVSSVKTLSEAFPGVPIFARALDTRHAAELKLAGATDVVTANTEAGTALASHLLEVCLLLFYPCMPSAKRRMMDGRCAVAHQ